VPHSIKKGIFNLSTLQISQTKKVFFFFYQSPFCTEVSCISSENADKKKITSILKLILTLTDFEEAKS